MDLYHVALFVHIIGAIIVVGVGFVAPILMAGMRRAQTVTAFRDWGGVLQKVTKTAPKGAAAILVTGLYMGITQHSFTQPWLAISLTLFVIAGGLATVADKHLDKTMEATGDAVDGPVPVAAQELLAAPRMHNTEAVMFGIDMAILFLMTNKPGLAGSLLATAAGLAIAGGIVARHARSHRAPAVAA